ncbi:MAG: hypothetical protein WC244_02375 [Patescibacteria group bacterium]
MPGLILFAKLLEAIANKEHRTYRRDVHAIVLSQDLSRIGLQI